MKFTSNYSLKNQSQRESNLNERLKKMKLELGEMIWRELVLRNEMDIRMYELSKLEYI